jgi:hypothetical protein
MQKPFNALSGWELKQLILGEVKQRMALDARFESTVPVPGAFLVFTVQVEHKSAPADGCRAFTVTVSQKLPAGPTGLAPHEIPTMCVAALDRHLSMDERFLTAITYPFVTWNHQLSVDAAARVEAAPAVSRPVIVRTTTPPANGDDPSLVAARAEVAQLKAAIAAKTPDLLTALGQEIADLRKQLTSMANGSAAADAESVDVQRRQTQYERDTQHKLVWPPPDNSLPSRPSEQQVDQHGNRMGITAHFETLADPDAAMRSSGSGAALAIAVGHTPDGHQVGVTPEMGRRPDVFHVETTHPALATGGIGSPDAARREGGLPVPAPQRGHTGIVDLPAGSF